MGHHRLGYVPKTRKWQSLVSDIAKFANNKVTVDNLANRTLRNVSSKFENIPNDMGVNAAFQSLAALSFAAQNKNPTEILKTLGIDSSFDSTPFQLSRAFSKSIDKRTNSKEYAEFAKAAVCDTIYDWSNKLKYGQDNLFGSADSPSETWKRTGGGAGFCELSRLFFAKFTERYIKYFLEREASAHLTNVNERDRFNKELSVHVNQVSRHAFESAKITQSFAAGWFNKNAKEQFPSEKQIKGFLHLAFGKMKEELRRQEEK